MKVFLLFAQLEDSIGVDGEKEVNFRYLSGFVFLTDFVPDVKIKRMSLILHLHLKLPDLLAALGERRFHKRCGVKGHLNFRLVLPFTQSLNFPHSRLMTCYSTFSLTRVMSFLFKGDDRGGTRSY